ncbi:hypothetical protein SRIMM317S_06930 [Streptomyces rimosus subsp. rimosus]
MSVKRTSSSWPARRPLSWKYISLGCFGGDPLELLTAASCSWSSKRRTA